MLERGIFCTKHDMINTQMCQHTNTHTRVRKHSYEHANVFVPGVDLTVSLREVMVEVSMPREKVSESLLYVNTPLVTDTN